MTKDYPKDTRKWPKGRKEIEDNLEISSSKFKQANTQTFIRNFRILLQTLQSLDWPPKEAAGLLENGRSREEEEEGKQRDREQP